jgi:hypothetical protein
LKTFFFASDMKRCCAEAESKPDFLGWLAPITDQKSLWDIRLRLYQCPSCGAYWLWKSVSQGHQDWDQSFERIASQHAFEERVRIEEAAVAERLAELKRTYERNGWPWRW